MKNEQVCTHKYGGGDAQDEMEVDDGAVQVKPEPGDGDGDGGDPTMPPPEAVPAAVWGQWGAFPTTDGRVAYVNRRDGITSWIAPEGFSNIPLVPPSSTPRPVSWEPYPLLGTQGWMMVTLSNGEYYFYNIITRKCQWDRPMPTMDLLKCTYSMVVVVMMNSTTY